MQIYNQSTQKISHLIERKPQSSRQASINEALRLQQQKYLPKKNICQMQFAPEIIEKLQWLFEKLNDLPNYNQQQLENFIYEFLHTKETNDVNQEYTKSVNQNTFSKDYSFKSKSGGNFFHFHEYGDFSPRYSARLVLNTKTEDDTITIGNALHLILSDDFDYKILRYSSNPTQENTKLCLEKIVIYFDPHTSVKDILIRTIKDTNIQLLSELPLFMDNEDNIGVGYNQDPTDLSFSRPRAKIISSAYYKLKNPYFWDCCAPKPEDVTSEMFITAVEKAFNKTKYKQA